MKPVLEYRPEIDGLRAVAVISVLMYHLGVWPVTGGFVGVDVFFVISGYLITAIILSKAAAWRFSFADFYEHRARRLLPALLATIVATFAAAAFLFAPEDLRRAATSTVAALLGISNISFWQESGYFDVDGILKPLLHTWSLAVELQFYVFWPAFLLVLARLGRDAVLFGIVFAILAGTAASIWVFHHDASAAFYLAPFRIHEFALGALVVCLEERQPRSRAGIEALFIGGIGAIIASLLLFDELTVFPEYAVLLPTVGTAMILYAGSRARSASLLRLAPLVHLGRISYSLYLVHWPLIVFTHYLFNRSLGLSERCALFATSIALAELSYRHIEKPFRRPRDHGQKESTAFYAGCAALACVALGSALHAGLTGGWVWRFPADLQAINSLNIEAQKEYVWANFSRLQSSKGFESDKRRILVVGDSQAADLVNVLVAAGFERKYEIVTRMVISECGFPYLPEDKAEVFWAKKNTYTIKDANFIVICKRNYEFLWNSDVIDKADFIIFSFFWREFSFDLILDFLADMRARSKASIYFAGSKGFNLSSTQFVNLSKKPSEVEKLASENILEITRDANKFIRTKIPDRFIDILGAICPRNDYCHVLTGDRKPIYWDRNHFTNDGAEFVGRNFASVIFPFLAVD